MEVQGSVGVNKLLRFDEDMFYAWCCYIGIMRAKLMWRECVTPENMPTMQQLLDCVPPGVGQVGMMYNLGFMKLSDYPVNRTNGGKPHSAPCKLDKAKVIPHSTFKNRTQTGRYSYLCNLAR